MTMQPRISVAALATAMTLVVSASACSKENAPPPAAQDPTAMRTKAGMTGEKVPGRAMVMLSGEQRQLINIRTTPVVEGPAHVMIRTVGIVAYDDARVANVNTTYLENKTRTTTVRVVLPNPDGLLRPGMYANAELQRDLGKQLLVPTAAVFNPGNHQYVFVQTAEGMFMPRAVELGPQAGDRFVVRKGLNAGELVVVDGTFLLDSESQLRAGSDGGEHQH
jgi:hypothetical protein